MSIVYMYSYNQPSSTPLQSAFSPLHKGGRISEGELPISRSPKIRVYMLSIITDPRSIWGLEMNASFSSDKLNWDLYYSMIAQ